MKKEALDTFDVLPKSMIDYLSNYGRHFNKKLVEFAVSKMESATSEDGELKRITPLSKEEVEKLLKTHGVIIKNDVLYDSVYVANMCKADYLGDSVPDDYHMARYIKNTLDDPDAVDGTTFTKWYASMRRAGIPIDWESML